MGFFSAEKLFKKQNKTWLMIFCTYHTHALVFRVNSAHHSLPAVLESEPSTGPADVSCSPGHGLPWPVHQHRCQTFAGAWPRSNPSLRAQKTEFASTLGYLMEVLTLWTIENWTSQWREDLFGRVFFVCLDFSVKTTEKINAKSIAVHFGGSFSFNLFFL